VGFHLRKSVSVGPFRFNLSSSGIGVSTGVRGFRIGTGPRGNYVHVGARGIYYRTSVDSLARSRAAPAAAPVPTDVPVQEPLGEIRSGSALQMVDSSSAELLEEIRAKRRLGVCGLGRC
jgi:hypothetical protein